MVLDKATPLAKWITPFLFVPFVKCPEGIEGLFPLQPRISIVSKNTFLTSRKEEGRHFDLDSLALLFFDGSFKKQFCNLISLVLLPQWSFSWCHSLAAWIMIFFRERPCLSIYSFIYFLCSAVTQQTCRMVVTLLMLMEWINKLNTFYKIHKSYNILFRKLPRCKMWWKKIH